MAQIVVGTGLSVQRPRILGVASSQVGSGMRIRTADSPGLLIHPARWFGRLDRIARKGRV